MAQSPFWGSETLMQQQVLSPDVLAYGDSWFWYPANNLMIPINALWNGTRTVLVKGKLGAELSEMVGGTPALWNDFRGDIEGYPTIACLLLSGGGNDFAGMHNFPDLLKLDCSGAVTADDCFDVGQPANDIERQPWRLMRQLAKNYQSLIDFVRSVRPDLPIILQAYDYAIPTGIGFGGIKGGLFGIGDWLQAPMNDRHVPQALQKDVVRRLIDDFVLTLSALADPRQNTNVFFVNTVGTLEEFFDQAPMTELLYADEREFAHVPYRRFMLIGVK